MLHLPLKCPIVKKIDVTFQIFIWKSCFSYGRFGFTNKMHVVSLTILLTHFCFLRLCGLDYLYHFKIYAHSLFYVLYGQTCYVLQNSAFCLLVWTEFGFAYTKQITLNKQMKEIVNSLCLNIACILAQGLQQLLEESGAEGDTSMGQVRMQSFLMTSM